MGRLNSALRVARASRLTVYDMVIDHAVGTAVDLGSDPDGISLTAVLPAVRYHRNATTNQPCSNCGHDDTPTSPTWPPPSPTAPAGRRKSLSGSGFRRRRLHRPDLDCGVS